MSIQYFLQHFDFDKENSKDKENKNKNKNKNEEDFEKFSIGDLIKVGFFVQENEKEKEKKRVHEKKKEKEEKRIQFFEGIVIAITGPHYGKKITLRKSGVEHVFYCKNPQIRTLKKSQRFRLRPTQNFHRSKLYYLRQRSGKRAFG